MAIKLFFACATRIPGVMRTTNVNNEYSTRLITNVNYIRSDSEIYLISKVI